MSSENIMEESNTKTKEDHNEINVIKDNKDVEEMKDLAKENSQDFDAPKENQAMKEEVIIKKKYGGLLPKKPPLISKDHEHAFFDSADWALGKKSKGPLEALRPKLEPSPHQQARSKSHYAPANSREDIMDVANADDDIVIPTNHTQETDAQKSNDNVNAKNQSFSMETESNDH